MRLSVPQGDGAPLRLHLQRAAAACIERDPMLIASLQPLPPTVEALWGAFLALRSASKGPVTHGELCAWQHLNSVRLTPWEVETLLCCDRAAREADNAPARKDLSV